MSWIEEVLFVLCLLLPCHGGDAAHGEPVLCEYSKSCILPCTVKGRDNLDYVLIRWSETSSDRNAYVFHDNAEEPPDNSFRNRTSLNRKEISKGNASLNLSRVKVQDEGTYHCFFSPPDGEAENTVMNLRVYAPVYKIDMKQVGKNITCSSEGIYPKPDLTWSTSPSLPLNATDKPKVEQNKELLYSISSSLTVEGNVSDVDYSCSISTSSTNKRGATLFKQILLNASNTETTITCMPNTTITSKTSLIWRFNSSKIILNQTKANIHDRWRENVKNVTQSGNLILTDLTSDHEGIYTCELITAKQTYVSNTRLMVPKGPALSTAEIVGWVFLAVVVLGGIILSFIIYNSCSNPRPEGCWGPIRAHLQRMQQVSTNGHNNGQERRENEVL